MKQIVVVFGAGFFVAILIAIIVVEFIPNTTSFQDHEPFWAFPIQNMGRAQSIILLGILWSFLNPLQNQWSTQIRLKLSSPDNWRFYCVGGIFTSLFAHLILAGAFDWKLHQAMMIVFAALPGGATGAYVYYRWREKFQSE